MATSLSNLLALLSLDESAFLKGLDSSMKASDTFVGNLSHVGGAVVLGAITAAATAVVSVGAAAFDAAETVDQAMDNIAVKTGAQGDDLAQLQQDWQAVFTSIPTDAQTASDAISILHSRLGISGITLQNLAEPLLEVTRILGGDLTQNAENFTRVIGDWGIPTEDASASLDALFVASQQTGADLSTLMQQVVQYGAPMRNFGFSFEQAGALLATFASKGVNTEIVMSGLRVAQGKFIAQNKDFKTGLWDTIEAIKNASTETEALGIANEVFGARAAADFFDTIKGGKFELTDLVDAMMNADGAIMDAANSTNDWGEKWTKFTNSITVKLAPIGDKIREGFGNALDELSAIFDRPDVQASISQFADFAVTTIGTIVDHIPDFIAGVQNFITFLQNNQGIVIAVFAALGVAAITWGVVTAAAAWAAISPLLPVIAVLALVAGAAYLLYEAWVNNFGGIQQIVDGVIQKVQPFVDNVVNWFTAEIPAALQWLSGAWDSLVKVFGAAWDTIAPSLTELWDTFKNNIPDVMSALAPLGPVLMNLVTVALPVLGAFLALAAGVIVGFINGLISAMNASMQFVQPMLDALGMLMTGIVNIVTGVIDILVGLFTGNFAQAFDGLRELFGGIFQTVYGFLTLLVTGIIQNFSIVTTFVAGFIQGIIGFFQNLYDVLVGHSIIPDLINTIVNLFTGTDWLALGSAIAEGIVNGISNGVGAIVEAARSAASAALEAAKGFLGINSPSRLFQDQVGANMALGLVKGWESILLSNPLTPALATATVDVQGSRPAPASAAFAAPASAQTPVNDYIDELVRLLRDLPNEISRAVAAATAKSRRA